MSQLSISTTAELLREGKLSPVELVEQCLARIDAHEDKLRAWVHVDRKGALAAGKECEAELRAGRWRGPLQGIPIGIKDIIDVRGMRTLAGSRILAETAVPAREDAALVARLRQARAIILGKTVTTEFACFDPPPTRNPWNLQHTPGGSSSGSAAAVAAGMCLAAIGSQTGGSITRPASYCGVVGIKPTYGRVGVRGVLPLAFSMDHPGPIARTVRDAAAVLQVIAGYDADDAFCVAQPEPGFFEAGAYPPLALPLKGGEERGAAGMYPPWPPLRKGGKEGAVPRLGLIRRYYEDHADRQIRKAVQTAVKRFEAAGATIVEAVMPASFDDVHRMHRRVMCAEMTAYHAQQFAARRQDYGPKVASLIEEGLGLSASAYAEARQHQLIFRHEMLGVFGEFDALLAPAIESPAPDLSTTGSPDFQSPWSYSGLPTVSLPVGLSDAGLPTALQLIGRPFDEHRLFGVAAWCEEQLGFNAQPPLAGG